MCKWDSGVGVVGSLPAIAVSSTTQTSISSVQRRWGREGEDKLVLATTPWSEHR